jgi:dCTP deaminase
MIGDATIRRLLKRGWIRILPFNEDHLQPVSYDVHLGNVGLRMVGGSEDPLDLAVEVPEMGIFEIPGREAVFLLHPREFILGHLMEDIALGPAVSAEIHGKSTLGRAGLLIHITAGLVDPGWGTHHAASGCLTIELYNVGPRPLRLWKGMPIGQMVFYTLPERVSRPYGHRDLKSHYVHSPVARGSETLSDE